MLPESFFFMPCRARSAVSRLRLLMSTCSAILSAFVDNIPFVATMIPLIKAMAPTFGGSDALMPLWWSLSLGACFGGNGTLIGASANLTVAGIAERNGIPFRFMTYTKLAFPLMLLHVAIVNLFLLWRYF